MAPETSERHELPAPLGHSPWAARSWDPAGGRALARALQTWGFGGDAVGVPIPKVTSAGREILQCVRNTQKHNKDALPRIRDSDKFYPVAIAAAEAGLHGFEESRRCPGLAKTGAS